MAVGRVHTRLKRYIAGLATGIAVFGMAAVLSLAPGHMAKQDDDAAWTAMASNYLIDAVETDTDTASLVLTHASVSSRLLNDLGSFSADHFDTAQSTMRERQCLAEAIYYEARSERVSGQLAVAEVIMNRVRSRHYPGSVCGVVYQGAERTTGCQFSFTCDGSLDSTPYGRGWDRAEKIADHVMMGFARPVTSRATHYHTTAVDPVWNDSLVRTRRIGSHIFYRIPNRSERSLLVEREA